MSSSLVVRIGADISEFQRQLKGVKGGAKGLGDQLIGVGTALTKRVTAPLMGMAAAAVIVGSGFQASMSNVKATTGATADEMETLTATARHWGRESQFSASQVADAMYFLGLASWDTTQIIDGLPGVLNLAASAGLTLGESADIMSNAITGFGLEAADAGRMADVLATANKNANTDVRQLGAAFKYVAPIAGMLGFTVEDTAAAIGLMANAGIAGSQAGTSLRRAILDLSDPTEQTADEMHRLGIEMFNADGTAKPLSDVMRTLRDRLGGMTQAQQMASASTLFSTTSLAGMMSIINASDDDFNNLITNLGDAEGSAEKFAAIMQDNLRGQLNALRSRLEDIGITIFTHLYPALSRGTDMLITLADAFSNLSPGTQSFIVGAGAVAAAIGPMLIVIGKGTNLIRDMKNGKQALIGVLAKKKLALTGTQAALIANEKATMASTAASALKEKATIAVSQATIANEKAVALQTKAKIAQEKATQAATNAKVSNEKVVALQTKANLANERATIAMAKANLANEKAVTLSTKAKIAQEQATHSVTVAKKFQTKAVGASTVGWQKMNAAQLKNLYSAGATAKAAKANQGAMAGLGKGIVGAGKAVAGFIGLKGVLIGLPVAVAIGGIALAVHRSNQAFYEANGATRRQVRNYEDLSGTVERAQRNLVGFAHYNMNVNRGLEAQERATRAVDNRMAEYLNTVIRATQQTEFATGEWNAASEAMRRLNTVLGTGLSLRDEEGNILVENVRKLQLLNQTRSAIEHQGHLQERYLRLIEEEGILTRKVENAARQKNRARADLDDGLITQDQYNSLMRDLVPIYDDVNQQLQRNQNRLQDVTGEIEWKNQMLSNFEHALRGTIPVYEEWSEAQADAINKAVERFNSYKSVATNMFDVVNTGFSFSARTVDAEGNRTIESMNILEMATDEHGRRVAKTWNGVAYEHTSVMGLLINNLQENQQTVDEWSRYMGILSERASEGFVEHIRTMGPESLSLVQEMVNGSNDELSKLEGYFNNGGSVAMAALGKELGEHAPILAAVESMTSSVESLLSVMERVFPMIADNATELFEQEIRNGAPGARSAAEHVADMTQSELQALVNRSPQLGQMVSQGLGRGISAEETVAKAAAGQLGSAVLNDIRRVLGINSPSRITNGYGRNVAQGLANGINDNAGTASSAAQSLGSRLLSSIRATLGINSPSREMRDIGQMSGEGLTQGLNNSVGSVEGAMGGMSRAMTTQALAMNQAMALSFSQMNQAITGSMAQMPGIVSASMMHMTASLRQGSAQNSQALSQGNWQMTGILNDLRWEFTQSGLRAMQGLTQGLWSGFGAVMSTARNIANNVRATMQNALRINSPSRVMADEVGQWIPKGIAHGIEANAGAVTQSLNGLASAMDTEHLSRQVGRMAQIDLGNPGDFKRALQEAKRSFLPDSISIASSAPTQRQSDSSTAPITNVYNYEGLMEGANIYWESAQDIRETMREIAWTAQVDGGGFA